jgi:hypothetical protein
VSITIASLVAKYCKSDPIETTNEKIISGLIDVERGIMSEVATTGISEATLKREIFLR